MKIAALAALLSFYVCGQAQAGMDAVRKVDSHDAPEARVLAAEVRRIGNEVHPQILALLGSRKTDSPKRFDVVMREHLPAPRFHPGDEPLGETCRETVFLNAGYLNLHPEELDAVVVHELTHVAQNYPNIPYRHAWQWYAHTLSFKAAHPFKTYPRGAPSYWTEGIADYVCAKLGHTNLSNCPQCNERYPHYTTGYSCAAAFLLYVDSAYGLDVIQRLNAGLRTGADPERFLAGATGKPLGQLWTDFQTTSAYTASAADFNELHDALGTDNGKSPHDAAARLKEYLSQHADIRDFIGALDREADAPPEEAQHYIEYFLYMRQQAEGGQALPLMEANLKELHAALGFQGGKPPADVRERLGAYLDAHPDMKEFVGINGWLERTPVKEFQEVMEQLILARVQPGWKTTDSAEEFLTGLKNQGKLPGWRETEHGSLTVDTPARGQDGYPMGRTFKSQKEGRDEVYVFIVTKENPGSEWKLKRAWETAANGKILRDFAVK